MQVDLRGLDTFVAEPECDHRCVDAAFEQSHPSVVWRSVCGVTCLSANEGQALEAALAYFVTNL